VMLYTIHSNVSKFSTIMTSKTSVIVLTKYNIWGQIVMAICHNSVICVDFLFLFEMVPNTITIDILFMFVISDIHLFKF